MRVQRPGRAGQRLVAGAAVAAAITLAACGGGGQARPSPSATPSVSGTPAPAGGAAAQAAVTAVWQEFFNARTPTQRRVVLLQNGQAVAQALATQARLPVAASATAKVSKVVLVSPTTARVTYTILSSGNPLLTNQSGVAVYTGGRWKVGMASFCRLLVLEYGGSTSSLPAACRGSGG